MQTKNEKLVVYRVCFAQWVYWSSAGCRVWQQQEGPVIPLLHTLEPVIPLLHTVGPVVPLLHTLGPVVPLRHTLGPVIPLLHTPGPVVPLLHTIRPVRIACPSSCSLPPPARGQEGIPGWSWPSWQVYPVCTSNRPANLSLLCNNRRFLCQLVHSRESRRTREFFGGGYGRDMGVYQRLSN